jgi:DNA polymerase III epsilon subunit-like protein
MENISEFIEALNEETADYEQLIEIIELFNLKTNLINQENIISELRVLKGDLNSIHINQENIINELGVLKGDASPLQGSKQTHLILDTETTGLPSKGGDYSSARIVQFAYQLCDSNGKLIESDSFYIKPSYPYCDRHDFAVKVHGITRAKATREGITISDFTERFEKLMKKTDIVVAHNYNFDSKVISYELTNANKHDLDFIFRNKKSHCTMRGNRIKLGELYIKKFGKDMSGEKHNAIYDVIACKHIYFNECNI